MRITLLYLLVLNFSITLTFAYNEEQHNYFTSYLWNPLSAFTNNEIQNNNYKSYFWNPLSVFTYNEEHNDSTSYFSKPLSVLNVIKERIGSAIYRTSKYISDTSNYISDIFHRYYEKCPYTCQDPSKIVFKI